MVTRTRLNVTFIRTLPTLFGRNVVVKIHFDECVLYCVFDVMGKDETERTEE